MKIWYSHCGCQLQILGKLDRAGAFAETFAGLTLASSPSLPTFPNSTITTDSKFCFIPILAFLDIFQWNVELLAMADKWDDFCVLWIQTENPIFMINFPSAMRHQLLSLVCISMSPHNQIKILVSNQSKCLWRPSVLICFDESSRKSKFDSLFVLGKFQILCESFAWWKS